MSLHSNCPSELNNSVPTQAAFGLSGNINALQIFLYEPRTKVNVDLYER